MTLVGFEAYAKVQCNVSQGDPRQEKSIESAPLVNQYETKSHVLLEGNLNGRTFSLEGNKEKGQYSLSVAMSPTFSISTQGSFASNGYLSLVLKEGDKMTSLSCLKE